VEPSLLRALVLGPGLLAQGLQDGGDGGGALGGQVAPDHPGAAERGADLCNAAPRVEATGAPNSRRHERLARLGSFAHLGTEKSAQSRTWDVGPQGRRWR